MNSRPRFLFLPNSRYALFLLLFVAVLLLGSKMLNLDGDLPRHLLMGGYILSQRVVPTTELFIHPYQGRHYVTHEWLAAVIFEVIYSIFGGIGLVVFSAFLIAAMFTLLYAGLADRLRIRLPVLLLVVWGAIATSLNWAVRPHLLSMFLLVIWLFWCDDLHRGKKIALWLFPSIMFLWSNLHGEFIAGILVLAAYAFGCLLEYVLNPSQTNLMIGRNIWVSLVSSAVASLLNPSGFGPWLSIFGFVNNDYLMSRMIETNAPDFQNPAMQILFSLLVGSIFILAIKKTQLSAGQGFLLAGFTAMGLIAVRSIHLYGIVAPFVLAQTLHPLKEVPLVDRLERTLEGIESQSRGFGWILTCSLALVMAILTNSVRPDFYQLKEPAFPVRAVEWLKTNPQDGNMLNDLNWGGYLGFNLWPEQRAFVDSVADVTGEVTRDYETMVTLGAGWQEKLKQYKIAWVILPYHWPLSDELTTRGWKIVYQDETAIVLTEP